MASGLAETDLTKSSRRANTPSPHVAIVGAGVSGLRCADVLLQHGFKITIFDGRGRIGGRIHQHKLPNGFWVDMGPNWIHGTRDNPIVDLANQTQTTIGVWDSNSNVLSESGSLLPQKQVEELSTMMWGIIDEAIHYSRDNSRNIGVDEGFYDFYQSKVIQRIPESESDYEEKRRLMLQMSDTWGAFVGSPVSQQSLKFFWLEDFPEGDNLFCAETYRKILAKIARPALSRADVRLNTKVTNISYTADDIQLQTNGLDTLRFDEVVVTSPLGWLKKNLNTFLPPLLPQICKAINSLGYGSLEKVFISFPGAFWLSGDTGEKADGYMKWLSPNYATDSNPDRWGLDAIELASIVKEAAHPTLMFYLYGDQSEYITRRVTELHQEQDRKEFLIDHFRPYYSRLPGYLESSEDCVPTSCLATAWLQDEMAGNGSYSNFPIGLENGDEDIQVLRRGIPSQGLWFAGEHTAPFEFIGTVSGAYKSGEAAAMRIVEAYDLAKND